MSKRFATVVVIVALVSAAVTASIFLVRDALTALKFNPFAEIIINNASGELILVAEIKQGDMTISARDIQPAEQRLIRFYPHHSGVDNRCEIIAQMASGRELRSGDAIGIGQEQTTNIRKDSINTAYRRSGI